MSPNGLSCTDPSSHIFQVNFEGGWKGNEISANSDKF